MEGGAGLVVDLREERDSLIGQPLSLPSDLFLDLGKPPEFLKEAATRMAEFDDPMTENLRRHLFENSRGIGKYFRITAMIPGFSGIANWGLIQNLGRVFEGFREHSVDVCGTKENKQGLQTWVL